jgi:hypothetical protein
MPWRERPDKHRNLLGRLIYSASHTKSTIFQVEAPVSIISVAGMYRTGKSFLLNHILIGENHGFEVGPTVEACTKGYDHSVASYKSCVLISEMNTLVAKGSSCSI